MADVTKSKRLNRNELQFAETYLTDFKAGPAAREAYGHFHPEKDDLYFTRLGNTIKRRPHVAEYIEKKLCGFLAADGASKGRLVSEVNRIAISDITSLYVDDDSNPSGFRLLEPFELEPRVAACVQSFKVEETYEYTGEGEDRRRINVGRVVEYKMWNKTTAQEMLMRHLKLYEEKDKGQQDRLHEIVDAIRASPRE